MPPDEMDLSAELGEAGGPEGDLFASETQPADSEQAEGGMPEFGEADETELDPLFAADAAEIFPDWSDDDYAKLQKLIDSRMGAASTMPMAEPAAPAPDLEF